MCKITFVHFIFMLCFAVRGEPSNCAFVLPVHVTNTSPSNAVQSQNACSLSLSLCDIFQAPCRCACDFFHIYIYMAFCGSAM